MAQLNSGDKAPLFELPDQYNNMIHPVAPSRLAVSAMRDLISQNWALLLLESVLINPKNRKNSMINTVWDFLFFQTLIIL